MNKPTLILTLPTGNVTATSLGIEGLAHHHSPGSGKHFHGRSILVDLANDGEKPGFKFLDEGGWRDPYSDSVAALAGVRAGSRTKTALSNTAFSCIPVTAYKSCHLVKTGGETTHLGEARELGGVRASIWSSARSSSLCSPTSHPRSTPGIPRTDPGNAFGR